LGFDNRNPLRRETFALSAHLIPAQAGSFNPHTRSRSFSASVASHDLLLQASIELVRTVLPTAKGIRLLGVTVSNFDEPPAGVADELPLFAGEDATAHQPDTAPAVSVAGR
jgi:DNA polymerase-4